MKVQDVGVGTGSMAAQAPTSNESLHRCNICFKTFTFSTNLTRHQRNLHGKPHSRRPSTKSDSENGTANSGVKKPRQRSKSRERLESVDERKNRRAALVDNLKCEKPGFTDSPINFLNSPVRDSSVKYHLDSPIHLIQYQKQREIGNKMYTANTQSKIDAGFKNIFSIMENYLAKTQPREDKVITTIMKKMHLPGMVSPLNKSPRTEKIAKNGYSMNRLRILKKKLEDNFDSKLVIKVLHILNKNGESVKYEKDNISFKLGDMRKSTILQLELINVEKKLWAGKA